ncbi:MAG: DUF1987 domain-containing protein [Bacteroidota bacterium]
MLNQRMLIKKLNDSIKQDVVHLKGTVKTPEIILDKDQGKIELQGRSIPEDAKQLYHPIIHWVSEYIKHPQKNTRIVFKLEYFNTASSKMIFELIGCAKKLKESGKKFKIEWHYLEDDDDILDSGETFQEITGLPFEFYPYD